MRLIDADALATIFSERVRRYWTEHSYAKAREAGAAKCFVCEAPTIEAEPVKHGKWRAGRHNDFPTKMFVCSACDGIVYASAYINRCMYNFCPNCGAKMDGESHE